MPRAADAAALSVQTRMTATMLLKVATLLAATKKYDHTTRSLITWNAAVPRPVALGPDVTFAKMEIIVAVDEKTNRLMTGILSLPAANSRTNPRAANGSARSASDKLTSRPPKRNSLVAGISATIKRNTGLTGAADDRKEAAAVGWVICMRCDSLTCASKRMRPQSARSRRSNSTMAAPDGRPDRGRGDGAGGPEDERHVRQDGRLAEGGAIRR